MEDNISKIKDRLGVVDVVSGYLKLQKSGMNFRACCPFHNEKTPSFFVSPERQIWHCFGCQKGGDIFTFIKEVEGVDFSEALRILAAKAGIELERFNSQMKDEKDSLYQICEMSARFFEKQLSDSITGKLALEYLKERGLKSETVADFRLGFAPDTWNALSGYLRNSGFSEKEIIDAGVAIKRQKTNDGKQETAGIYDRFRSRIIFPIADMNGRVVGFTGRIFNEVENSSNSQQNNKSSVDAAKYINTPQTLIYDKSRILYGLDHSRGEIRKKNKCILVEGNMDAIMSYQAGATNVVASSGTALTPTHLAILKRFTGDLDFCFDTDSAGAVATKRGIGMALAQNFNVKVISINDKACKDPADYVQKYGGKWLETVGKAKPVVEFYFDKAKENYNPESAESKRNVISAVAPFVKRLLSSVERSHWVSQLAYFLRVKENAIENDIASAPDDLSAYEVVSTISGSKKSAPVPSKIETPEILNQTLLSLVIKNPTLFKEQISFIDHRLLAPFSSQVIAELAKENIDKFDFGIFSKKFDHDKSLDLEFAYLKAQALWEGFGEDDLRAQFSSVLDKLKQKTIHLHLADLEYEIRAAEATGDKTKIVILAQRFNKLTEELARIHKI